MQDLNSAVNPTVPHPRCIIAGLGVDAVTYDSVTAAVLGWARGRESRYVAAASVNNAMEAVDSTEFRHVMSGASLVTPDGMPLVCGLRFLGHKNAVRVYGPDLMLAVVGRAEREGLAIGLYGATEQTLALLRTNLLRRYPRLRIAYCFAPPFRELTAAEDGQVVLDIGQSGARILFVGLGTPKQERWMAAHRGRIPAVMLGVGAAFDFLAGVKPQAPRWMMRMGLEWLFRLATEPRRLWRRYLFQNPRFVLLFLMQLLGLKRFSSVP